MADLLAPPIARPIVQLVGNVRRELVDVARQPRLVLLLVLGPFLVLSVFAVGFDQQETVLTTAFVGPEGVGYEEAIERYDEVLEQFVEPVGYSQDVVAAQDRISRGELDLVVQFPPEPAEQVLDGEQAIINVFHEKLDPVQARTVEIVAQLAVLELNAQIMESLLGDVAGDDGSTGLDDGVGAVGDRVEAIDAAAQRGDLDTARSEAAALEQELAQVDRATSASLDATERLGGSVPDEQRERVTALQETTDEMAVSAGRLAAAPDGNEVAARAESRRLVALHQQLTDRSTGVVTLDPAVLARPFRADAANLQREEVGIEDFFAPNAVVLLLAHLALTLAAMGVVRSESIGLFEVLRVGPVGTRVVLGGTYTAYLLVGAVIGLALMAATVGLLGVPLRGQWWDLVPGLLLVLSASIGLGVVVGLAARSDTQAVQGAMLVLLLGLFFGGFFIARELFRPPVRAFAQLLPVTHGIDAGQDVMLRGEGAKRTDLLALVTLTLAYGGAAAWMLRRRLRIR